MEMKYYRSILVENRRGRLFQSPRGLIFIPVLENAIRYQNYISRLQKRPSALLEVSASTTMNAVVSAIGLFAKLCTTSGVLYRTLRWLFLFKPEHRMRFVLRLRMRVLHSHRAVHVRREQQKLERMVDALELDLYIVRPRPSGTCYIVISTLHAL